MAKEKEDKIEEVSRKEFNDLAAKVRRMSDNWKRFCAKHIGDDADGEVGSARLTFVFALALVCVAGIVFAEQAFEAGDKEHWGVAAIRSNGDLDTDGGIVATGAITGVSAGNGTGVVSTATIASSDVGNLRQTTITIDDLAVPIVYNGPTTNHTGGTKVYVFPEGRILVHGVTVDSFTVATNPALTAAEGGDYSMGTVQATLDTLASTEVDLCPATSIDPITNITSSALAASAQFDGTATAKDVYVNMLIDTGDLTAATTAIVDSATIKITWSQLGDY